MYAATRTQTARRARSGQAMIESCLVVILMSLIFFGMFRIARLYAASEILTHAATAGARAEAVGFNRFMVHKVVRAAAIPNAGVIDPSFGPFERPGLAARVRADSPGTLWDRLLRTSPLPPQFAFERSRIPLYLGAETHGRLGAILDYEQWDSVRHASLVASDRNSVRMQVSQAFPLRRTAEIRVGGRLYEGGDRFHRAFYAADEVNLRTEVRMDRHHVLYLQ